MGLNRFLINTYWKMVKRMDDKRMAALPKTRDGVSEIVDIDYIGDNDTFHKLDIYRPQNAQGKLPVIIDIHGGGWGYGTKEINRYYCLYLAQQGFAVVNINYHLLPARRYPEPMQDVFAAFDFVLANGEKYGLDTQNIFLTGDSAGGHMVLLAIGILNSPEMQTLYGVKSNIKFKAVGLSCTAFNFEKVEKMKIPVAQYYIKQFFDEKKSYRENPLYPSLNIRNYDLSKYPPLFVSSCEKDMVLEHTLNLVTELDKIKHDFVFDFIPQSEYKENKLLHVFNITQPDWEESRGVNDRMCAFFKKYIS